MVQIKAPISVSGSDAAWSKTGAGTTILCTSDHIASPDDATYISNSAGDAIRVKVDAPDHPNKTTGLKIKCRCQGSGLGQEISLRLFQGSTGIADYGSIAVTSGSFEDYEQELSEAEAAAVTDYSDLYVEVQSSTTDQLDVSVIELEAADRILRAHVLG